MSDLEYIAELCDPTATQGEARTLALAATATHIKHTLQTGRGRTPTDAHGREPRETQGNSRRGREFAGP